MNEKDYSDIINLPPHKSRNHAPMSGYNRAAQFSPFAALTGYEESIENAAKEHEEKMLPSDFKEPL